MTTPMRQPTCPPPDRFFDLADGSLDRDEADALLLHVDQCEACRRLANKAKRIHATTVELRDPPADEAVSQAIWEQIAPAARSAARQHSRRNAWRILTASPRARLTLAASLLLVLGVGVSLLIWWVANDNHTSSQPVHRPSSVASTGTKDPSGTARNVTHGASHSRSAQSVHRKPSMLPARLSPVPRAIARKQEPSPQRVLPRTPQARFARSGVRPPRVEHGSRLACGARILHREGQLRITQNSRDVASIRLAVGEVSLKVPKLKPSQRVEVVTPDARVRVHGTRFTVRSNGNGTTDVAVQEGVVWIHPKGRNRQTVVLGPGGQQTVQGEAMYLTSLLTQLRGAVRASDTHQAVRLGRRYLSVTSQPQRAGPVRLLLAGALERLGRRAAAVAQYEKIIRGGGGSVEHQNALAYLARLFRRSADKAKALQTWRRLLQRYPRGIHAREALLSLVRAGCRSKDASVSRYREHLARRYASDPTVVATLKRCRPREP